MEASELLKTITSAAVDGNEWSHCEGVMSTSAELKRVSVGFHPARLLGMFHPKLVTRYITAELVKIFLAGLLLMTVVIMVAGVAQQALREDLGFRAMLRIMPFMLPNALCFSVPGTMLYAVCCVYGRMSADNEVIALKSMGISPVSVVVPAIVFSALMSLVSVWLIDLAFSWGYIQVQRVIIESADEIAYGILESRGSYTNSDFSISVTGVDGRRLLHPTITVFKGRGGQPIVATAEEAELRISPAADTLYMRMTNGSVQLGDDDKNFSFPDSIELPVPLGNPGTKSLETLSPSHIAMRDIPGEIDREEERIRQIEGGMAAEAGYQMITGGLEDLNNEAWDERLERLGWHQERLNRLYTEPHRRWASGFSCLAFVLVGVPLAIRLKHASYVSVFGMCFLPILICYYPLFAFGLSQAKEGALPPSSVWLGDIACCVVGLLLLRKVIRH